MWWTILALILAGSLLLMYRHGPAAGLGAGVLVSLLFPSWLETPINGVSMDLRIATAFVLLLAYVAHPKRQIDWKFSEADWAVFVLYFTHVISDCLHEGFMFSHFVRAFGEWSIPYIAGRLAIQKIDDWRWLTQVAVIVASIFATVAVIECATKINAANVFGERPMDDLEQSFHEKRSNFRWIQRAEGPTYHPIWFGMIQTLMLPWTFAAAQRGLRGDGPGWWMATPLWLMCGIAATVARGPVLATGLIIYLITFVPMRKHWKPLLGVGVAAVFVGLVAKDIVLPMLDDVEQRKYMTDKDRSIELWGQRYKLSAMSHRWLVFAVYREAIADTGLFGFGTSKTSSFPVQVTMGSEAKLAQEYFPSIDCEYLLLLLRFGWLGLVVFAAVCILSVKQIFNQARLFRQTEQLFPYAVAATIAATTLALIVEWMPHDYGFMFLWLCGVANGPRMKVVQKPKEQPRRRHSHRRSSSMPETTYAQNEARSAARANRQSEDVGESVES